MTATLKQYLIICKVFHTYVDESKYFSKSLVQGNNMFILHNHVVKAWSRLIPKSESDLPAVNGTVLTKRQKRPLRNPA